MSMLVTPALFNNNAMGLIILESAVTVSVNVSRGIYRKMEPAIEVLK